MTWKKGRATIEQLLERGDIERVTPSEVVAARLLLEADLHLRSARSILDDDPTGAFQLSYDAARKSCAALLAVQGLRSTSHGGHVAVQDAVREQFNGEGGAEVFGKLDRLRRLRNTSEYPDADTPAIITEDAEYCIEVATELLAQAADLIDRGGLTPYLV